MTEVFPWRPRGDGSELDVLVCPRASRAKVGPLHGDRLKISVTAAPVDGQANDAVIALIAKSLGVARSRVAVVRGQSSRKKTLRVAGIAASEIGKLCD